jgi:FkbM family methyltransferase
MQGVCPHGVLQVQQMTDEHRVKLKRRLSRRMRLTIPRLWLEWRYFEDRWLGKGEAELRAIGALIERGRPAIDVGAHMGIYTRHFLAHAGRVIAFEPNPELGIHLHRAFGTSIDLRPCALTEVSGGEAKLRVPIFGGMSSPALGTIETSNDLQNQNAQILIVPLRSLDDEVESDAGFLKIDAEGHELAILKGARRLLLRARPTVLVEATDQHRPDAVSSVEAFLREQGYEGYFLSSGTWRPISSFDLTLQSGDRVARGAGQVRLIPGHIANFLFVPKEKSLQIDDYRG